MAPMSRLVTPPALQMSGSIHRGSALCFRPTESLNQTPPSKSLRSSLNFVGVSSGIHELFRRRAVGLVLAKERRRDLLRAFRGEQFLGEGKLFVVKRAFERRVAQKPFPVALEDGLGARNLHPGRLYSRKG